MYGLVLNFLSTALALTLESQDDANDPGTIASSFAAAALIAVVLWFFSRRGHRWPKWVLLLLLLFGAAANVAFLDARSLLGLLDVAGLVVLLRGWSALEAQPASR